MAEKVSAPFNTPTRRFRPGDSVTEADLAGSAHTLESLAAAGLVEGTKVNKKSAAKEGASE